jgi:hypothetical protein
MNNLRPFREYRSNNAGNVKLKSSKTVPCHHDRRWRRTAVGSITIPGTIFRGCIVLSYSIGNCGSDPFYGGLIQERVCRNNSGSCRTILPLYFLSMEAAMFQLWKDLDPGSSFPPVTVAPAGRLVRKNGIIGWTWWEAGGEYSEWISPPMAL